MAKKKKKKGQQAPNPVAKALDIALSLALLAGMGYYGYSVVTGGVTIDQGSGPLLGEYGEPIAEQETEPAVIFGSEEIPNSEVHNGSLILVNNFTPIDEKYNSGDLVSLYFSQLEADAGHSFGVRDANLMLREDTANAVIAMLDAFYQDSYDNSIVVKSGHRTREDQQALYEQYEVVDENDENAEPAHRAAMPGFSEHETGLCVDLGLDNGEYDGTGIYSWIEEHAAEFGLILRYPENKFELTNIIYESWHYRYVGKPHAAYIMQNGLCLEEYIDLVKEYAYDGEHLRVTDCDGQVYEIYYYPEDHNHETTLVPVPGGGVSYTVCGNNVDGFIVTIATGETETPPVPGAEDAASEEDPATPDAPADAEDGDADEAE